MNIGIDIVDITRMEKAIKKRPTLKDRLFTASEQKYCDSMSSPGQHYAARFAAKEAVVKALGHHFSWTDIEVARTDKGQPRAVCIMANGRGSRNSL